MGNPKHIALYNPSDESLWKEAEEAAREEHGGGNAAEGEVLAQIAAAYIGIDGPLEGGERE